MDDARQPFHIALHPSRTLALALASAYAGAGACLLSLDLGWGIKTLMFSFLILSGFCDLRIHTGAYPRRRVKAIVLHPQDQWRVVNGAGEILRGEPVCERLLHPLAVCFSIRLGNGRKLPVLVLGDMCTDDAFRGLRAWLSVHGEGGYNAAARPRPITGRHDDSRF